MSALKVRLNGQQKTGNKKRATCHATLLQNELNSDVARFSTHIIKSVLTRVVKRATSLFNSGVLQQQVARFVIRFY